MEITKHSKLLNRIKIFWINLFLVSYLNSSSQDLKAGYMQVSWLSGYTYSGTIYLLTDASINIQRPYIILNWGVKTDTLFLANENPVSTGILKKYYGTCTYPGPGVNQITYIDSFRIPAIQNIAQSDNQSLKLKSILNISAFNGPDTAPLMQNSEIRLTAQSDKAIFDPKFQDAENDSLSFQLVPCSADSYRNPTGVSINNKGVVSFSRDSIGRYAFSFIVTEWRKDTDLNYQNIGSSQADFAMDIATDVSITEQSFNHQLSLYPNPTTSFINIVDEQNELQGSTIEITNSIGQSVMSCSYTQAIDVSELQPGCYFVSITTEQKKVLHTKFIRQ